MANKREKNATTSQSDKFKQIARELGADDNEGALTRAIEKMKPPPPKADEDEDNKPGQ